MSDTSEAKTVNWQSTNDQQEWFDKFKMNHSGSIGLNFEQFQRFLNSSVYPYLTQVISSGVKFSPDQEQQLFRHFDLNGDNLLGREEFALLCQNWLHSIYRRRSALVIVDVQNDFIDGSLALIKSPAEQDGAEVVPVINKLLGDNLFDTVVYTQDWHPTDHIGFHDNLHLRKYTSKVPSLDAGREEDNNNAGQGSTSAMETNDGPVESNKLQASRPSSRICKVFDRVYFDEGRMEQILWPRHCVQGSWGAELHPKLKVIQNSVRIMKGTLSHVDAYSAFWDNLRLNETDLREELTSRGVTDVFFCGLAYDYCVAASALDSRRAGFMTYVIEDACRGIDSESIKKMTNNMVENDILIVSTTSTRNYLTTTRNDLQVHHECPRKQSAIDDDRNGQGCGIQAKLDDDGSAVGNYKMRSDGIRALMVAACFKKAFLQVRNDGSA